MKRYLSPNVFWPILVLAAITISGATWTYIMVAGSDPLSVRNIGLQDIHGNQASQFAPGDLVGVRREVCSTKAMAIEFFPSLRSEAGALVSLGHGATYVKAECRETVFLFELPEQIPQGRYQYGNIVKYQSNWIGRDEGKVYPPLELEVVNAAH